MNSGKQHQGARFVDFHSMKNDFQYKYLVNVDGFVAAYRLAHLLMGNSLVFKQESPYYEHYYKALKPWKHYVPVERDLSDLLEKIEWAKANDEEAQRIVKRANRFVQKHLYPKDIFCYHAVAFRVSQCTNFIFLIFDIILRVKLSKY